MTSDTQKAEAVGQLLDTPDLANALESEQFKKFLDQVPIAIAVSDLGAKERVVYANPEFEKLSGLKAARLAQKHWAALAGTGLHQHKDRALSEAVVEETDFVGTFRLERAEDTPAIVDAYSNVIEDDNGKVCFRLVALVDVSAHAFKGRDGGTITLHSIVNGDGCRIVIADDGIGLPEGETWPKPGKLGALIARSLTENAKAEFDVNSSASEGTRVTIAFKRSVAATA